MNILSLQSQVAYGHVGNSAAAFALQRLGHAVWQVPTVLFSNHPGHGRHAGEALRPDLVRACVAGLDDLGVLARCDGVLSGYVGEAAMVEAIGDAVARARAANPRVRYCCDPVIGDAGRVYTRSGVFEGVRDRLIPLAQVATPNAFELALLTARPTERIGQALDAAAALRARGPATVLLTSYVGLDTPADRLDVVAAEDGGAVRVRMPRLPRAFSGAGDLIAALFFARRLEGDETGTALARAAAATHRVLLATEAAGSVELRLLESQDALVDPGSLPAVERLR